MFWRRSARYKSVSIRCRLVTRVIIESNEIMKTGRNDLDDPRCDAAWWYGGSAGTRFDRITENDPEDDNFNEIYY